MQIIFIVSKHYDSITGIDEKNLDESKTILPKHIDILTFDYLEINYLKDALELFDESVCSFSEV